MIVKYISGVNQKEFILNQNYEIAIKECNPYDVAWSYDAIENQYGVTIKKFKKDPKSLEFVFKFRGSMKTIRENLDAFFGEAETDIYHMLPGKVYVDTEYLEGYFIERKTEPTQEFYGFQQTALFFAPYPFWIRETTYSFLAEAADPITILPGEEEPEPEITMEQGIMFPEFPFDFTVREGKKTKGMFDLPTDLKRVRGTRMINNESYLPCHFRMTIYGPVTDPEIVIANHIYKVETTVFVDERLVIDSRNNTVIKIGRLGEETDLYNSRYKLQSVFEKIPPGQQTVTWPAGYGIDITLYDERSEPRWTL